ncbi:family 16 glycosylhydrolase [Ochrovirga pacifica]|uniref:family 16 glycosylhydrolase n=1 Tax=Ochrovirga pacifica TaxID=1042376 RepID=UPI000255A26D|nr:family 16 glycosylhydrolase [Ochrovirga pacifica]
MFVSKLIMPNSFLCLFSISVSWACSSANETQVFPDPPKEESQEKTCEKANHNQGGVTLSERTDTDQWQLVWQDNFDYSNEELDKNWISQNGPSGHILSSRWRDNAVVKNGVLELIAKKESRGGAQWTTGNIWTRKTFGYGYYECKYKYAGAAGTNNSFWLFPRDKGVNNPEVICELDINEGHYPNEVNTNRHHWKNGKTENNQLNHTAGLSPGYAHTFDEVITTQRIRFSSQHATHFHIREFSVLQAQENCQYPQDILALDFNDAVNLSKTSQVTASGVYKAGFEPENVVDESTKKSWVSQKNGEKWLEFSWEEPQEIGHVQFVNGWQNKGNWNSLISDYKIEAWVDGKWKTLVDFDVKNTHNYAEEYHVYGLDWSEDELKFYIDNQLIRTLPNTLCKEELNIYLSLAILEHAGEVTDAIDGTSMKIDWVKYYQKK